MQAKVSQKAKELAEALGAKCAFVTVFWDAGDQVHMQSGGQSPWPTTVLLQHLLNRARDQENMGPRDDDKIN